MINWCIFEKLMSFLFSIYCLSYTLYYIKIYNRPKIRYRVFESHIKIKYEGGFCFYNILLQLLDDKM